MKNDEVSKGYLIVASRRRNFYHTAIMLMEDIKHFDPETPICFVTEEDFHDGRESIADYLIPCGRDYREKLWALYNTPFDITAYIDADMECVHEDIKTIFDQLGDNDIMFTDLPEHRTHIFREWRFEQGKANFKFCGAVCLYDKRNELVVDFMKDWHRLYLQIQRGRWWPRNEKGEEDYLNYPSGFKKWDQFPLWWLSNKVDKYKSLKIGIFEDSLRWNHWLLLAGKEQPKNPTILWH